MESGNHRLSGVGRDLWQSFGPTSLLEQAVQDHVQMAFGDLQGRELHSVNEQLVQECPGLL